MGCWAAAPRVGSGSTLEGYLISPKQPATVMLGVGLLMGVVIGDPTRPNRSVGTCSRYHESRSVQSLPCCLVGAVCHAATVSSRLHGCTPAGPRLHCSICPDRRLQCCVSLCPGSAGLGGYCGFLGCRQSLHFLSRIEPPRYIPIGKGPDPPDPLPGLRDGVQFAARKARGSR